MADDDDLNKKLDEGLALLRVLRPPIRRIGVVDGDGVKLLKPEDIVYFTTGEDRRLLVFTADGQQYFNFKGLADMAVILADDPRFHRVHKSFLVNLEQVTNVRQVPGGRELSFAALPDVKIKVAQDQVKDVETYFGL
jgi:DNA-binding LytR/AlgR family response regulator